MPACRSCVSRVAATLLVVSFAGCASNPAMEMASGSAEGERQVGDEQARLIERTIGLDRDAKIEAYVQQLGQRLAQHASRKDIEYRFYVADMAVPNAFAIPGGHVYVSRGLLALVNSEDELAGVIGHEIGHVEARHAVKRSRASLVLAPVQVVAGLTGIAASLISPDLGASIIDAGQTATQAVLAPYSRDQEREADRLGQEIVARAGWDPRGLTHLLGTLGREERLSGAPASNGFLATHPATPERVAATAAYADTLVRARPEPIAKDRVELLAQLDGLLLGDDPVKGTFVGNRFLLPRLALRMAFPPDWEAGRTAGGVGARSQDKQSVIVLQPAGIDTDPASVVREQEKRAGVKLLDGAQQTRINGLTAVRRDLTLQGQKGGFWVSLTWVQLGRIVWSIVAVAPGSRPQEYAPAINDSIASFGQISDADKAEITAARLRLARAQEGETLRALGDRTGSLWSVDQMAVASGLAVDVRFAGGELVKIPLREAFAVP
jgi:predicted Zn-dependent protease